MTADDGGPRLLAGRYRIDGLLGRGGMSEVYFGYDERLDRRVAIKVLRTPGPVPGHAYAETGKPAKALPQLRYYVQNADLGRNPDEAEKVIDSRFVVAQLLAAAGKPDAAVTELDALRPLLARAFGEDSTQVRNLNKQIGRLRTAGLG